MRDDGFVLREDASLKAHLTGLRVVSNSDRGQTTTRVPAYFRMPEEEIRKREFPYLVIDLLSIVYDPTRQQRFPGVDETWEKYHFARPPGLESTKSEWHSKEGPLPVNFTYQVSSFARYAQHDRQILGQLMRVLIPRYGALQMIGVPEWGVDNTRAACALDVVGGPVSRDYRDGSKRVFSKVWTLLMMSEMWTEDLVEVAAGRSERIQSIFIDIPFGPVLPEGDVIPDGIEHLVIPGKV